MKNNLEEKFEETMSKFNELCGGIVAQHKRELPQKVLDEIMDAIANYNRAKRGGTKAKKEFIKRIQKIEKMLASQTDIYVNQMGQD